MASQTWGDLEKTIPEFKKANQAATEKFEKEFGLAPSDIAHILVGGSVDDDEPIMVMRTKKAVTAQDLLPKMKKENIKFIAGKLTSEWTDTKYTEVKVGKYTMQEGEKPQYAKRAAKAFCVADSKVVIWGRADSLKAVLERDKKPELSAGMQTVLKETDLSKPIAFAVDLKAILAKKGNPPGQDPFSKGLGLAEGVAGQATLGKSDSMTVIVLCKDATTADDLRKVIEGGVVMVKQMPGLPREVSDGLGALKVTNSGSKLTATSDLKVLAPALIAITMVGQRTNQTFEQVGKELGK
jgi:hypothetical protein